MSTQDLNALPDDLTALLDDHAELYEQFTRAEREYKQGRMLLDQYVLAMNKHAASRSALDARLLELCEAESDAERWRSWASHQEWCRWCAEDSPLNCSDGAPLFAVCHPENEDARRYCEERGIEMPAARSPEPARPADTPTHNED